MSNQGQLQEVVSALEAALEWIDAVPASTVLPAMPGFDRDWVNGILDALKAEPARSVTPVVGDSEAQRIEALRSGFEEWAEGRFSWSLQEDPDNRTLSTWNGAGYDNRIVNGMFMAWSAALDSVEIELPCESRPSLDGDPRWHSIRNQTIKSCARAIEAQGLKVRP